MKNKGQVSLFIPVCVCVCVNQIRSAQHNDYIMYNKRVYVSSLAHTAERMCDFQQRTSGWQAIDWLKKWAGELIKGSGCNLTESDKYVSDDFQGFLT